MYAERTTKTLKNRCGAVIATTALALGMGGCAGAVSEASERPDEESTASTSSALAGSDTFRVSSMSGVVRVSGASVRNATVQGVLVSPSMVLISRYAFDHARRPLDLSVETRPNSVGERETSRVIDVIDMPRELFVLLSLQTPFVERPAVLDPQAATVPINDLRCKVLRADGSFLAGNFSATPAYPDGRVHVLTPGPRQLTLDPVADLGMACGNNSTVLGLLVYASSTGPTVGLMSNIVRLQGFLAVQPEVFAVRADPLARPFSLFVTENGVRRCLSVSATSITTADCDSGLKEQEFYFDRRPSGADAILSAYRGRCLAGGPSSATAHPVETRSCDQSAWQSFAATFTPNGEVHYVQAATNRCLTKTGTTVSLTTDCRESPMRNWWISWH